MRFSIHTLLLFVALTTVVVDQGQVVMVTARKPSRSSQGGGRPGRSRPQSSSGSNRPSVSKRKARFEEEEEEDEFGFDPDDDESDDQEEDYYEEEEEDHRPPSRRPPPGKRGRPSSNNNRPSKKPAPRSSSRSRDDYDDDEEYDAPRRRPSPRGGRPGSGGRRPPPRGGRRRQNGRVVPYGREPPPSTFSRGLSVIRSSMPDPSAVRDAAVNSLGAAREATSSLSSNLYREVKGLTSSELEQVMLKATRPDDAAVKGKHVERLVGITYQISTKFDIYDSVLRKLWAKMAEKDWRTTIKALYILHRFSADGSSNHSAALKARLRELRRSKDEKRKTKFFSSKLLLRGDGKQENAPYQAFLNRYAHFVLLRAQMFGGLFDEIAKDPDSSKAKKGKRKPSPKPITSTSLRVEHLEAAALLLKAGVACQLRQSEECENTALAVERVCSDLIGLTAAVSSALNRALKDDDLKGADPMVIKKWCDFYSEDLTTQTRALVRKTTPKLDAFGLFLPSRMGNTLSPALLQKGMKLGASDGPSEEAVETPVEADDEPEKKSEDESPSTKEASTTEALDDDEAFDDEDKDEYDEYEYDEEEYYDDDEE